MQKAEAPKDCMSSDVPKIIHQIWHSFGDSYPPTSDAPSRRNAPPKWDASRVAWTAANPGWTHMMWNEKDSRDLIALHYPKFLKYYDFYPNAIQRVDAARYFIVHHYGGVYIDMDLFPIKGSALDDWIGVSPNVGLYVVREIARNAFFTNSFFAAQKGSAILGHVCNRMTKQLPWWALTHHVIIMVSTGPWAYTAAINENQSKTKRSVEILPADSIFVEKNAKSWCEFDTYFYGAIFKNLLFVALFVVLVVVGTYVVLWNAHIFTSAKLKECQSSCSLS
jgi:mannosyltransferase OCH1-like enzyme